MRSNVIKGADIAAVVLAIVANSTHRLLRRLLRRQLLTGVLAKQRTGLTEQKAGPSGLLRWHRKRKGKTHAHALSLPPVALRHDR